MSRYAIGDIHGAYATFQRLLQQLNFNRQQDTIYLVGDMVGRGANAAALLHFIVNHQDCVHCILGNHELRLLAAGWGVAPTPIPQPLIQVLEHPYSKTWLQFLQQQPLVRSAPPYILVHAGVLPGWDTATVLRYGHSMSHLLNSPSGVALLRSFFTLGKMPQSCLPESTAGILQQAAFQLRVLTTIRCIDRSTKALANNFTAHPQTAARTQLAWFNHPDFTSSCPLIFGHWAALGLYANNGVRCLDSGCGWKRSLTAFDLDRGTIMSEPFA